VLELQRERHKPLMRVSDRLVKLIALAAIVASVLPLGAKLWWGFDLATHFRVQYVVLDTLLLVAFALRRFWLWSAVLAVCAAWSASWVAPYVPVGPNAVAAPSLVARGSALKLMSANVWYHNHSTEPLLEIVRRESPDVLLLVEYTPEWAAGADELRATYPHRLEAPGSSAWGIALFSRFPLDSVQPFALGSTAAIDTLVRTPAGPLRLIGVHLRSPTSARRSAQRDRQLDMLVERLAGAHEPIALMGDFNITPYSPVYGEFLARTGFTDTRRARTLSPSWPAFLPILGIPIDHCIVSPNITIVSHHGLPRFGSDHYPILAELALPAPPAAVTNATDSATRSATDSP
jgi:endonuclease/exonuclease/phosphatase (EEP) superfamily protein YafD